MLDTETALSPLSPARERGKDLAFKDTCLDELGRYRTQVTMMKDFDTEVLVRLGVTVGLP